MNCSPCSVEVLSDDILSVVFSYLNHHHIVEGVSTCSRRFNKITKTEMMWQLVSQNTIKKYCEGRGHVFEETTTLPEITAVFEIEDCNRPRKRRSSGVAAMIESDKTDNNNIDFKDIYENVSRLGFKYGWKQSFERYVRSLPFSLTSDTLLVTDNGTTTTNVSSDRGIGTAVSACSYVGNSFIEFKVLKYNKTRTATLAVGVSSSRKTRSDTLVGFCSNSVSCINTGHPCSTGGGITRLPIINEDDVISLLLSTHNSTTSFQFFINSQPAGDVLSVNSIGPWYPTISLTKQGQSIAIIPRHSIPKWATSHVGNT